MTRQREHSPWLLVGFDLNPLHTFFGDAGFSFDASDGVTSTSVTSRGYGNRSK